MIKQCNFFTITLFCAHFLCAQNQNFVGKVVDDQNQALTDVSIVIDKSHFLTTDQYGSFALDFSDFSSDSVHLFISYVGCISIDTVLHRSSPEVVFRMDCSTVLKEVVVKSFYPIKRQTATVIPLARISSNPTLTGEIDVLKAVQTVAGANFSVEGSTDIVVRGGSVGENQVFYNGIDLYNNAHLFGLVSQFNSPLIKNVNFYKTGFPVKYGGKLSSVIDIETKNYDDVTEDTELRLGLISSSIFSSHKITPKLKIAFDGRRTLLDAVAKTYYKIFDPIGSYVPNFYNVAGTGFYKLNDKSELSLWLGYSKDRSIDLDESNRPDYRKFINVWDNFYSSINYRYENTKNLLKASIAYTDQFSNLLEEELVNGDFKKNLSDANYNTLQFNLDNITKLTRSWAINYGVNYNNKTFDSNFSSQVNDEDPFKKGFKNPLVLASTYLSVNLENDKTSSFVGVRLTSLPEQEWKTYFEPRLYLDYRWKQHKIFLSGSLLHQFEVLNYSSSIGNYLKIWIPVDANNPVPQSIEGSIGYGFSTDRGEFTVEGYKKERTNLYHTKAGENVLYFNEGYNSLEKDGKGDAYGLEFSFRYRLSSHGLLDGSYAYSSSILNFPNLNNGQNFNDYFERRHNLKLFYQHNLNTKWTINGQFTYLSGRPFTFYPGSYPSLNAYKYISDSPYTSSNVNNSSIFIYNGLNNKRLPAHHRLDILVKKKIQGKKRKRELGFGVYNIYARTNPFYVERFLTVNNPGENAFRFNYEIVSYFNFIPSFYYTIFFK